MEKLDTNSTSSTSETSESDVKLEDDADDLSDDESQKEF